MTVYDALRKLYPRSRRSNPVGIVVSTSCRRVYNCIVCGASESESAKWPKTAHVKTFEAKHDDECGKVLLEKAGPWGVIEDLFLDKWER